MTEQTALITLSMLSMGRLTAASVLRLYQEAGSALHVMENRGDIRCVQPEASDKLCRTMASDLQPLIARAEEEQQWAAGNGVRIVTIDSSDYPDRMRHCEDAPLVLYVRGGADLNATCALAVVGTRQCTPYGRDAIQRLTADVAALCPAVSIISGLAYGVDISSHRAAMEHHLTTIGVVAHGQDTLYPSLHRQDANRIISEGGAVVTEYPHGTRPEARNFLTRNRIIAAMSDATLVVESASHGGSLVTACVAQEYGREVFAVPGPINSPLSAGCNNLIQCQKAALVMQGSDIVNALGWQQMEQLRKVRRQGIERQIFNDCTPEEQLIVSALQQHGDITMNAIAAYTSMPVSHLQSLLFSLEIRGMIKTMAGNIYHLIS